MRIGILGAKGFIGRNFKRYLLMKKIQTTTIEKFNFNIPKLKKILSGIDFLYDFSVVWQGDFIDQIINNSFCPFLIASLLTNKQKLIWVSTSAIYSKSDYGISKLIAERALLKFKNVKILRLSNVYGSEQSVSEKTISSKVNARRIQRFVAAYKLIKENRTKWISNEKSVHGFYRRNGRIIHEIKNDIIYPTYIEDVLKKLYELRLEKTKTTEFYGPKISNYALVKTIQELLDLNIEVKYKKTRRVNTELISTPNLTDFKEGLKKWIRIES